MLPQRCGEFLLPQSHKSSFPHVTPALTGCVSTSTLHELSHRVCVVGWELASLYFFKRIFEWLIQPTKRRLASCS